MNLYTKDESGELWWCNRHGRRAEYLFKKTEHVCDPKLGGIAIPCVAVNLTGIVEIEEVPCDKSH